MKNKMRIAIQNKGRLMDESVKFLKGSGLKFELNGRQLLIKCEERAVEILFVRCKDIPTYLEQGVADFGIVGENVLYEQGSDLEILESLGFGKCSLVIAAPEGIEDLDGERIATSYPNSLKRYLKKKGVNASVVEIGGSVEAAPTLGLADAICDITQSGRTLKENGLRVVDKILDSEAVLIGKSKAKWNKLIQSL